MAIPKIIHQTVPLKTELCDAYLNNIELIRRLNPDWEYRLYDDNDIQEFILDHYGFPMLIHFNRINLGYGAAKADFFRYLLMYVYGGVYLDIKSAMQKSLNDVLLPNDTYILSSWRNRPGQEFELWGLYFGLGPVGEYQQWHIICEPRHVFLEAVIKKVISNIKNYDLVKHGTGRMGVLRVTGPLPYTQAIYGIQWQGDLGYRKVDIYDLGFRYSIFAGKYDHYEKLSKSHYTERNDPVVLIGP